MGEKANEIRIGEKEWKCPKCGCASKRHSWGERRPRGGPVIKYAKYYCPMCVRHFSHPMDSIAPRCSRYTKEIHDLVINLREKGLTYIRIRTEVWRKHGIRLPDSTAQDWGGGAIFS